LQTDTFPGTELAEINLANVWIDEVLSKLEPGLLTIVFYRSTNPFNGVNYAADECFKDNHQYTHSDFNVVEPLLKDIKALELGFKSGSNGDPCVVIPPTPTLPTRGNNPFTYKLGGDCEIVTDSATKESENYLWAEFSCKT